MTHLTFQTFFMWSSMMFVLSWLVFNIDKSMVRSLQQNLTVNCGMAERISFDVSLSLNCTDLYKGGGGA